jgi:hypothetical protein
MSAVASTKMRTTQNIAMGTIISHTGAAARRVASRNLSSAIVVAVELEVVRKPIPNRRWANKIGSAIS